MTHPGKHPALSVVIPTYNGRHLLQKHLPRVLEILKPGDEVIIVDDASSDDTEKWIRSVTTAPKISLHYKKHSKNRRFAAAVNTGVRLAKRPFVLLLNNDVSPLSEDFRAEILYPFLHDPELFAVGCAEVSTTQADAPISGRGTGGFRRGLLTHWYDSNQHSPTTLWTSGGSMAFDREKFLEIGGMDTLFYPAYEEDRDLSYRALKHGWKIRFLPHVRVLHQHETTNSSVFGRRNMEIMSWKNQFLLVWKNITDPILLLQHVFWLPYHLTISNLKTKGVVGAGFIQALQQLPDLMRQRRSAYKLWKRTDKAVLSAAT